MVEIIPKPVEEAPKWQVFMFYFLVFLLIATVIGYFIFLHLISKTTVYLQELENKIESKKGEEMLSLEKEVLYYKKKIKDFAPFLEAHIINSKLFDFLEKNTHPKVFFSDTKIKSVLREVDFKGGTDNFISLGQQISIFKQSPLVERLKIGNVGFGKKGGIEFDLTLLLNKELFKY